MNNYTCVSFDEKNQRFCIYKNNQDEVFFSYWREFKKHGIRCLKEGMMFSAILHKDTSMLHSRGMKISEIKIYNLEKINDQQLVKNKDIDLEFFLSHTSNTNTQSNIFINCNFSDIEIDNYKFHSTLTFINCNFLGNFRLINCYMTGDTMFPNCCFEKHFSLKNSIIAGNIHLECTDFSGLGGVSFRGVRADNIYLDLGVNGGEDLFWFNEMEIKGVVSIGGSFKSEIQFLRHQDTDDELTTSPKIGAIIIGEELYDFEQANKTTIFGTLRIQDLTINKTIKINNTSFESIIISGNNIENINISNISTERDFLIENNMLDKNISDNICLSIKECSIGRHLKIFNNKLYGKTDFNSSAVSEVTYLENNIFNKSSTLDINSFTSSRFLIHPINCLFKNTKPSIFSPNKFSLLSEKNDKALGDQYCSLKHWFADSGKLEMEDIAFFHMRNHYHPNKFGRLIWGGFFGWGVRLSNIGITSLLVIVFFTIIYALIIPKISFSRAIALSAQSFISSFFGEWSHYAPDGITASLVTIESFLGVLLITIFIGAYIRKLLR